jgi:glutaredoxin
VIVIRLYVSPTCPHCKAMLKSLTSIMYAFPPGTQIQTIPVGILFPFVQPFYPSSFPEYQRNWIERDTIPTGKTVVESTPVPHGIYRELRRRGINPQSASEVAAYFARVPQIEVVSVKPLPDGKVSETKIAVFGWDDSKAKQILGRLIAIAWAMR